MENQRYLPNYYFLPKFLTILPFDLWQFDDTNMPDTEFVKVVISIVSYN